MAKDRGTLLVAMLSLEIFRGQGPAADAGYVSHRAGDACAGENRPKAVEPVRMCDHHGIESERPKHSQ